MSLQLRQHQANDVDLLDVLHLIQAAFAYMNERIDPPSSMHRLTIADIAQSCRSGEVWSTGNPIHGCMILKLKPDALYLGKLAIDNKFRGCGIGKHLIECAVMRARQHRKTILEIYVRVELKENHRFFESQGFTTIAKRAHSGYSRPTYLVMRRPIQLCS